MSKQARPDGESPAPDRKDKDATGESVGVPPKGIRLPELESEEVERVAREQLERLSEIEARLSQATSDVPALPESLERTAEEARQLEQRRAGKDQHGSPSRSRSMLGKYMRYSHLGILFLVAFGGCFGAGYVLDQEANTAPVGVLGGTLLGIVVATWLLYREIMRKESP